MEQVFEFAGNHLLLVGGFVAVLGLLAWTEIMRKVQGLTELTPAQAVAWINDPSAVVIDISPVADFNKGHIVNARNLQASRLSLRADSCRCGRKPEKDGRQRSSRAERRDGPMAE